MGQPTKGRIVVGVDGSANSAHALAWAAQQAEPTKRPGRRPSVRLVVAVTWIKPRAPAYLWTESRRRLPLCVVKSPFSAASWRHSS